DVLLHRRPTLPAPLHRPVRHCPAFGVEDALPSDVVILVEVPSLDDLLPGFLRQLAAHEIAHLVAERELVVGKAKIHGVASRAGPGPAIALDVASLPGIMGLSAQIA